jgi:hypothetical protein
MTLFEHINKDIEHTKKNVRIGLYNCSILRHYEIYSRFDLYKKEGYSWHNAFLFVVFDYNLSEMSVYRIIKQMECEV